MNNSPLRPTRMGRLTQYVSALRAPGPTRWDTLIQIMWISQVVNGVMLPFVLIFMLRLINDKTLMGDATNSRPQDWVGGQPQSS